jgi:CO/xanthine dehydrogenase Mo-binding subunit
MNTTATLTRRSFVAGSGSLLVGFSLSASMPGRSFGATSSDLTVDSWIEVTGSTRSGDGTLVTVYAGKVELGTGVQTALTQIVAEELGVLPAQVSFVQGDTDRTPGSQGYTAGSKTVQTEGPPLRAAAATALRQLLSLAAEQSGVSASQLQAVAGLIGPAGTPGRSYGTILGGRQLHLASSASAPLKPPASYTLVGQPLPRVDLPDKFSARFTYSADMRLPGMLHARVLRPSGRNARFAGITPASQSAVQAIPGFVQVVQQGNFVAVVASDEYAAIVASRTLVVNWTAGPAMIVQADLPTALQDAANVYASDNEVDLGNVDTALAGIRARLSATYFTPFQMHGAMGASSALADVDLANRRARVWSGTQGPYPLRAALAVLLGLPEAGIRVIYVEAAGCYGHNGADDVAAEAALISKLVGKPVRLQWTRQEEHGWEPLGPAMVHQMRGGVVGGSCMAWEHAVYTPSHNSRPAAGSSAGNLLPAQQSGLAPADAPALAANSGTRNGPVTYAFPNNRLVRHFVKSFQLVGTTRSPALPLTYVLPRSTALRSLGGLSNSFANESFMDELAALAHVDPLVFRLKHSSDARAVAVLQAAADRAGWTGAAPAAPTGFAAGRGIAFLRYETVETYVATVVEVLVNRQTGAVQVMRVVVAHDCGLVINPDGLRNQIEGNVIQGISRTLKEEVSYTADRITSVVWQANANSPNLPYPVIHFDEVPAQIECVLIDRPNEVAWGAGEPVIGTLPGAIGNAIFQATGVRVRRLPMTPEVVKAALAGSGG